MEKPKRKKTPKPTRSEKEGRNLYERETVANVEKVQNEDEREYKI